VTQSSIKRHPSDVLAAHRDEVVTIARTRGSSKVRVLDRLRGEDGPASDIDIVADFPVGTSLLTVIGLEQALRDLLGVAVHLGPAEALRQDMRDGVSVESRLL
jgi:predicted nucleotidyltransferase